MRNFLSERPTLRGFVIIAAIALIVVALRLEPTLAALFLLARIAFFLAIAFFLFLMWRERRDDIGSWSARAKTVFYGSALVILAAIGSYFWHGLPGYDALGLIGVLACAGFAMWRVWRDEHTYR